MARNLLISEKLAVAGRLLIARTKKGAGDEFQGNCLLRLAQLRARWREQERIKCIIFSLYQYDEIRGLMMGQYAEKADECLINGCLANLYQPDGLA